MLAQHKLMELGGHPMEYKVQLDRMQALRTNKANEAKRFRLWTLVGLPAANHQQSQQLSHDAEMLCGTATVRPSTQLFAAALGCRSILFSFKNEIFWVLRK